MQRSATGLPRPVLHKNVSEQKRLSHRSKLKVSHVEVLTILLYASGTLTVYSRHAKQLNYFHRCCLPRLLHTKWKKKIPYTEVLEQASIPCVHTLLQKFQARWAGHVARKPDSPLSKQLHFNCSTHPHVFHMWARPSRPDWLHQLPPDPQKQISKLKSRSTENRKDKQHHVTWTDFHIHSPLFCLFVSRLFSEHVK